MALQGSIDTFALDDVLRLVANTAKTGRLTLRGSRGTGELVVRDGLVLDGSVSTDERVGDLGELVCELLRFEDGVFEFEAEAVDGLDGAEPAELDALLDAATDLLGEWREIERVVPGPRAAVALVLEAPGDAVTIDPVQWRAIAAIGSGALVEDLSERLRASDLEAGRVLCSLVEVGLIRIEASSEALPLRTPATPDDHGTAELAPWDSEPFLGNGSNGTNSNGHGTIGTSGTNGSDSNGHGNGSGVVGGGSKVDADVLFDSVHQGPSPVALADVPSGQSPFDGTDLPADHAEPVEVGEVGEVDAADFARRLAELPPRAAKAVAAAARATSVEEREAALSELDGTGEEVDHDMLLALLGPVEG